jgi:hypothetical protein
MPDVNKGVEETYRLTLKCPNISSGAGIPC